MYEQYWRLKSRPFSNAPDPQYFYHSKQHDEALMKLSYAVTERMGACYGAVSSEFQESVRSYCASRDVPCAQIPIDWPRAS